MDPALVAVAGALSTVAAVLYKHLNDRIRELTADRDFWRDRALDATGLAEIATSVAEKRRAR